MKGLVRKKISIVRKSSPPQRKKRKSLGVTKKKKVLARTDQCIGGRGRGTVENRESGGPVKSATKESSKPNTQKKVEKKKRKRKGGRGGGKKSQEKRGRVWGKNGTLKHYKGERGEAGGGGGGGGEKVYRGRETVVWGMLI